MLKARGTAIIHGEGGMLLIDALSRGRGERRPDRVPGRQAAEDWTKNHQTLDDPRPPSRDAGESREERGRKAVMSRVTKIVAKAALKRH